MTINETFTCPVCKGTKPILMRADPIMSDLRSDILRCGECDAQWRVYSKIQEMSVEVIYVPEKAEEPIEGKPEENISAE